MPLDATVPEELNFAIGSTNNVIFDDGRLRWVTDCDYPAEPDAAAPGQVAMSSVMTAIDESTLNIGQFAQGTRVDAGGTLIALSSKGQTRRWASGVTLTYIGSQTDMNSGVVNKHIDIRGWSTESGCTFFVRHDGA